MTESATKHDCVDSLLHKLCKGEHISKDLIKKAENHYSSIILELKSYKNICEFGPGNGNPEKSENERLKHELEQLRADHSVIAKELNYYTQSAKQQSEENPNIKHLTCINTYCADSDKLRKELETQNLNHGSAIKKLKQELETVNEKHRIATQHHEKEIKTVKEEHTSRIEEFKKELEKANASHNAAMETLKMEKGNHSKALAEFEQYKNKEKNENKRNTNVEVVNRGKMVGQDQGHSKAMEKLREQNLQLHEEKDTLLEQINELRNRLSIMAGHKLTSDNPAIADLSDSNRPTQLAERFKELYDEEWTRAYEEIGEKVSNNDEDIIEILAMILNKIDHFCGRASIQQLNRLMHYAKLTILEPDFQPDGQESQTMKSERSGEMSKVQEDLAVKLLKDFRKSLGILSKGPLAKIFRNLSTSRLQWKTKQITPSKDLSDFIDKSLELVWLMKIQNPPMQFVWSKSGDKYNKNTYTFYTKRGETVTQCVWPAMVLHADGPLMSKGIVQGK